MGGSYSKEDHQNCRNCRGETPATPTGYSHCKQCASVLRDPNKSKGVQCSVCGNEIRVFIHLNVDQTRAIYCESCTNLVKDAVRENNKEGLQMLGQVAFGNTQMGAVKKYQ